MISLFPQTWSTLTLREHQVATMICLGLTNRDVARILCISPETVKPTPAASSTSWAIPAVPPSAWPISTTTYPRLLIPDRLIA